MYRIILVIAVLAMVAAPTATHSQDAEPKEPGWTLPEGGPIPYSDLLQKYSQDRKLVILYSPQWLRGEYKWSAERDGQILRGHEIDLFVADALEHNKFALAPIASGWNVVPGVEVITRAPVLSEAELAIANPAHWASVRITLRNTDANVMTGILRIEVLPQGGAVQPVPGTGTLLICNRVDRLRVLTEKVRKLDDDAQPEYRRYQLREGVVGAEALRSLRLTFREKPASFALSPNGDIVARATPALQADINTAVLALE